ncbi:MAG: lamin tail domain-containing protein, partial [Bacteroidota bacterium]|nr:lamin tail domain-containing protein [Bacteroidota bacterium]
MYRGCSLLIFLFVLITSALAQLTEDFSDGELTSDPAWSGDLDLFIIADEDGELKLRSNSAGAATYYMSTPSALAANAFWEILVDLRLNTSGSNYVNVHLISDDADLVAAQNTWFVRIGGTQDRVELFKKVSGTTTSVIASQDGVVNSTTSNIIRLRVERTADLIWTVLYDDGDTGTFATLDPTADPDIATGTHFGILIQQNSTASMVNNHFFDDIVVDAVPVDENAPELISTLVIDANTLQLLFNEAVSMASAETLSNYNVDNGIGEPASAVVQGSSVQLVFAQQFQPGVIYSITVDGIADQSGNTTTGVTAEFLLPGEVGAGDLVINEVLYDPIGSGADFVELHNRSESAIDLAGIQMANTSNGAIANHATITTEQWILMPGEFVVLTPNVESIISNYPQSRADRFLQTSLPNYVNTEGAVVLLDNAGNVIDRFTYHDDLHFELISSAEGFSLER